MNVQRNRGQALVLMSLTLLLLTLMVFITISFSVRVREKMETQSVADLAAYSSAVATARTFNSLALMNRAETGQMVALTSVVSLVSYTSMVRATMLAIRTSLQGCAPQKVTDALDEANTATMKEWAALDGAAGVQGYNIAMLASSLGAGLEGNLRKQLNDSVNGGPKSFAAQMAKLATEGSKTANELTAGDTAAVSVGELDLALLGYGWFRDHALASRGYSFITRREVLQIHQTDAEDGPFADFLKNGGKVTTVPNGPDGGGGSTYWGKDKVGQPTHGGNNVEQKSTAFLIAEDHAQVTVAYPGCPTKTIDDAMAYVRSTDSDDTTDAHVWQAGGKTESDDDTTAQTQHSLLSCPDPKYCPNVFVGGLAYNTNDTTTDNIWAQPKLFSYVKRDYKARQSAGGLKEPWLLHFSFQFSPARVSQFDNRGLFTADGTDISVQGALGTGLAYYHRRLRWREPPNLWNPFWRATLISADVDKAGDGDVQNTVGGVGAAAYKALIDAGYKGVH